LSIQPTGYRCQQPGRRSGAGQRQRVSGRLAVQRGRTGGPFGQRQRTTSQSLGLAKSAARSA